MNKEEIRHKIVEEARSWIGVRFRHQGRNRRGIDCVGLVMQVKNAALSGSLEYKGYQRRPIQKEVHNALRKHMTKIRREDVLPGDIVLLVYGDLASHLGILTEDTIVHAFAQCRKVVEEALNDEARKKIAGYYRFPELD